ncbi:hypothetical protein HMPREF2551_00910 [Neisseria sp. HMSC066H01]|nr:hypothetical protein HMPREF2551_00910 [Neisseria sp. HMSC066H01]
MRLSSENGRFGKYKKAEQTGNPIKIKFLQYSRCFQTALRTEKSKVGRLYPFRSFLSTTAAKFYPQILSMHKTRCHILANEKFLY